MALIANNISGSASNSSRIGITGSVIFANTPGSSFPSLPSDTVFYVSGLKNGTGRSVFTGDVILSGTTYVGTSEDGGGIQVVGHGGITMMPYDTADGTTSEIRFKELATNGGNYVALKAPDNIGSTFNFTLPNADGLTGHVLKTNGSGNTSYVDASTVVTGTVSLVKLSATSGLSGSLTKLTDGTSYLVAGPGVTITSQSNGQVTVTGNSNTLALPGSDTQVLFNDVGVIGSDSDFVYNKTTNKLTVAGDVQVGGHLVADADEAKNIFAAVTTAANTITIGGGGLVATGGDIRIGGNDIQASDGQNNITLTSNTLTTFAGDIKVTGNDIQSSDSSNALTFSSDGAAIRNVKTGGDLIVGGNDIRASDGTAAITLSDATGDVTMPGDLAVNGGDLTTSAATFNVTGATNYNIGTTTSIGTIAVGRSTNANTVTIGAAACTDQQTVNIATGVTGTGWADVTIGSLNGRSDVALYAGGATGSGIDIRTDGGDIDVTAASGGNVNVLATSGGNINIGATSTTGNITVGGASTSTGLISIGQSTVANTIAIGNAVCLGIQTVNIATNPAGGTGWADVTIGSTQSRGEVKIYGGSSAGDGITIETDGGNIQVDSSTAGNINIGENTTTGNITIGGEMTGTGVITLGKSLVDNTVNIGNANISSAATQTINIGAGSAGGDELVTIGSPVRASRTVIYGGETNTEASGDVVLSGSVSTKYVIGGPGGIGAAHIKIGRSVVSNTIQIGNAATGNGFTQTINMGNSTGAGGETKISIASSSLGLKKVYIGRNGAFYLGSGTPGSEVYIGGNYIRIGDRDGSSESSVILTGSVQVLGVTTGGSGRADLTAGAAEIGSWPFFSTAPDLFAMFGHQAINHGSEASYALIQSAGGVTYLNAKSGQGIYIRDNNEDMGVFTNGFISLTGKVNTNVTSWYGNNYGTSGTVIFGGNNGIYLSGSVGSSYYIGGVGGSGSINVGRSVNTQTINVGVQSANATGETQTINLGHYTPSGGSKNVNVRGDTVKIGDTGGTVQISNDTTSGNVSIGTAANIQTLNFGTGAAVKTVTVGSTNSTSALTLDAGTGAINIGNSAFSRTINIGPTSTANTLQTINICTNTGGGGSLGGPYRTINIGAGGTGISGYSQINMTADYVNIANNSAGCALGFFAVGPVTRQTTTDITNNVTSGGTANTLSNFTSLVTYSSDAAAIRGNFYQIGVKLNAIIDALQAYGLM